MGTIRLTVEQKKLVEDNVDLAHYLAKLMWSKSKDTLDLREVTSVAYQGLVTAALRFDPLTFQKSEESLRNGKAFAGYARRRIIGSILDWQRSHDHVPRRQRSVYKSLQQAGYGEGRTLSELADITGLSVDKIRTITHAVEATVISVESVPETWEGSEQYATDIQGSQDVESSVLQDSITGEFSDAFAQLEDLQQVVVALKYYEGFDLPYIATHLGVSLSLVRELHSEAILVLHAVMVRVAS